MKEVFSHNEDSGWEQEIEEAIYILFDDMCLEADANPKQVFLYRGVKREYTISDFFSLSRMMDDMIENSHEVGGEYAESFTEKLAAAERDTLQDSIRKTIELWAANNKIIPDFYTVDAVTKIAVNLSWNEAGDWEVEDIVDF